MTIDKIHQFVHALNEFWKPLFILMFFSGIRIVEASALKLFQSAIKSTLPEYRYHLFPGRD